MWLFSSSFDLLKHLKTCIDEERIFPRRICFVNLHPHPAVLANVGFSTALELDWTFVKWETFHDGNLILHLSYLPPCLVPIHMGLSVLGVVVESSLNFTGELLWTSARARLFKCFVFEWQLYWDGSFLSPLHFKMSVLTWMESLAQIQISASKNWCHSKGSVVDLTSVRVLGSWFQ